MEAGHNEGSTRKEPDVALIGRGSPAEMLSTTESRDERGTVRGREGPHHLEGRREIPPSTKAARAAAAQHGTTGEETAMSSDRNSHERVSQHPTRPGEAKEPPGNHSAYIHLLPLKPWT